MTSYINNMSSSTKNVLGFRNTGKEAWCKQWRQPRKTEQHSEQAVLIDVEAKPRMFLYSYSIILYSSVHQNAIEQPIMLVYLHNKYVCSKTFKDTGGTVGRNKHNRTVNSTHAQNMIAWTITHNSFSECNAVVTFALQDVLSLPITPVYERL